MSHFVYAIYSEEADRYYIGETSDLDRRIKWHNIHEFESASTKNVSDWKLKWRMECATIEQGRRIEKFIKSMKSRKFIERLLADDGTWLLERFPVNS